MMTRADHIAYCDDGMPAVVQGKHYNYHIKYKDIIGKPCPKATEEMAMVSWERDHPGKSYIRDYDNYKADKPNRPHGAWSCDDTGPVVPNSAHVRYHRTHDEEVCERSLEEARQEQWFFRHPDATEDDPKATGYNNIAWRKK